MKKLLLTLAWYIINVDKVIVRNLYKKRLKKAIREACELSKGDGRKYLVLDAGGRPVIFSKKRLKHLIDIRYFKKGTTIQEFEKKAIFITK